MSNGHRWSKFWWQDWDRDIGLKSCSLAAQGLWMRLLCIAHDGDPIGHVTVSGRAPNDRNLAALVGGTMKEVKRLLAELEDNGVFSRTRDGVIYSRRMVRDTTASEQGKLGGKNGGNPDIIRGTVSKEDRQRRFRRSDAPLKAQRIFEQGHGRCHWCDRPLQTDHPGIDFFQVDHVVAIRDGGGNEDWNLVAACAECNHKRARHNPTPTTDPNQTLGSESIRPQFRPQPPESEPESQVEPEAEERKPEVTQTPFFSGTAARAERLPDALEAALAEAGVAPPEPKPVGAEVVQMAVRRTAKAMEMRIPYGEVRSAEAQIEAMQAQPKAVGAEATMGLRWRPAEPVRTVEEQLAWLRANP